MPGELKSFLTHKRSQIQPESVGLKGSPRRRSPGLTREDMAELVGVSFKWYQLFESGKAAGVSRRMVERVARVLRLDAAERHYLLQMVGHLDLGVDTLIPEVPAPLAALLTQANPLPMALYSPLLDVLASNRAYAELFPPASADHDFAFNKLWRLFLDPVYRAVWCDWASVAARVVSDFRFSSAACVQDRRYQELIRQLSNDVDFARVWSSQTVHAIGGGTTRFTLNPPGSAQREVEVVVLRPAQAPQLVLATLLAV